jgi:hypothetical protein
MRQEATERFRTALTRAIAQVGGDRAAEKASGVSKSVWYDAKSGRAVPDDRLSCHRLPAPRHWGWCRSNCRQAPCPSPRENQKPAPLTR